MEREEMPYLRYFDVFQGNSIGASDVGDSLLQQVPLVGVGSGQVDDDLLDRPVLKHFLICFKKRRMAKGLPLRSTV